MKDGSTYIQYQLWTTQKDRLPEKRLENGHFWDNIGGYFEEYEIRGNFGQYRVMKRELPTAYAITTIVTGYYKDGAWIWKEYFQPRYSLGADPIINESEKQETKAENGTVLNFPRSQVVDIINFCGIPRSRYEIMEYTGHTSMEYFRRKVLKPKLDAGYIRRTEPVSSSKQKYVGFNQ